MYVSSFRILEARSCPHPVMSVFEFAKLFVASIRFSAATASMSSMVGIGGASGVGTHARESLTRVFIFYFLRGLRNTLCGPQQGQRRILADRVGPIWVLC